MDGDRRKCPIVDNEAIRLNLDPDDPDNYLMISATHDSIHVFPDSQYNYLHYYDARDMQMKAYFLGHSVLAELRDAGIPTTHRDSITTDEHRLWSNWIARSGMDDVEVDPVPEPLALPPGDPIEAEVQKAHEHLDEELHWFLPEWEAGRDGLS